MYSELVLKSSVSFSKMERTLSEPVAHRVTVDLPPSALESPPSALESPPLQPVRAAVIIAAARKIEPNLFSFICTFSFFSYTYSKGIDRGVKLTRCLLIQARDARFSR